MDSVLSVWARCPDCAVAIGEAHVDGCDVARCLVTGLQRLSCESDHDCGADKWIGRWPGDADCERLGWMIASGLPDLNRLIMEAKWDQEARHWVSPD